MGALGEGEATDEGRNHLKAKGKMNLAAGLPQGCVRDMALCNAVVHELGKKVNGQRTKLVSAFGLSREEVENLPRVFLIKLEGWAVL